MSVAAHTPAEARILSGDVRREVFRFGAPLAVGMALQTTFNLVDAYLVSRLAPEVAGPALGAIGICDQVAALGTIVSYGLTTASAAMIAHAEGRGDRAEVDRLAWQSLLLVLALSVVFGVVTVLFARPILTLAIGAKGEVAELGVSYLRVMGGGSFSIFLLLQLTAVQRALGSAKTPAALLVLANVLNLFLAVLLVYGPGPAPPIFAWGTPVAAALGLPRLELLGAAVATVLARTLALVPVVILLVRRFRLFARGARRPPDAALLGSLWRVAWPSSAQLVLRIAAMLFVHSLVARAFTTDTDWSATTALGVVFRLETMALFLAMGWGSAAQTFVGQNLGAGGTARARASGWTAAGYNAAALALLAVAYVAVAEEVVAYFDPTPAVVAVGGGYLRTVAPSYVALGTGIVLGCAITGAGATRAAFLLDLAVVVGCQLPACLAAVALPGASLERLWGAVVLTNLAFALVYLRAFRRGAWMTSAAGLVARPAAGG